MVRTNRVKTLVAFCAIFPFAGFLHAQSSTQGAIAGTVEDATSAVVGKASITIHNDGTNAEEHLTADDSGYFKEPLLEPGTYTVTITSPSFEKYVANRVTVQVGQLTNVMPHLTVGGASDTVMVSAEAPILNTDSPDFASNVNQRAIENIPVNNRRWSALALMTPGVTVDSSGFGLVSVRGMSTVLNNVEIDGADDNQAYFAEERGRTREAYSTSASAVREFQVNTGVYPAEYGRAAGGVINSVTKSGTNELHGEAYFYDRESKWNAYNDQSTITTLNPATNTNLTTPFKPKDIRKIYGFTVGGPIMKDKLFFLYTYDQHSRIFPLSAVPANPASFYSLPNPGITGNANSVAEAGGIYTCNLATGYLTPPGGVTTAAPTLDAQACTMAARLGLSSYSAGATSYDSGITGLNSDLGLIPRTGYQEINTPKLDYQINSKEHVSVLYHRLRWDSPGGVQTNATGTYSLDATGTDFVKLDYGVAKLTSLIKGNISNELLYGYGRELNDEGQYPLSAYSKNNLMTANGNVPYTLLDSGTGFYLGSPYYSYRPKYPDERKWQIGDTLYYQLGNHSFKFGTDTVHNYDLTNQAQYYEGYYQYTGVISKFLTDLDAKGFSNGVCDSTQAVAATATISAVGTYPCYTNYTQDFGPTTFDFATLDYAFFGQDNWKLLPRLTLELGVRYDYESLPSPVAALTAPYTVPVTGGAVFTPFNGINNHPSDKNNFGPRVGFSWDMFGTGQTVLRGGYGLYYGRITNGNIGTALATTGSPLAQSAVTYTATAKTVRFPNTIPTSSLNASLGSAYYLASNLQNPQVHEFDLQLQQTLGHGTVVQASYLGALGRELPNFLNVNLNPNTLTNVTISIVDTTGKSPIPNATQVVVPTFTSYGNPALLGPSASTFQSVTEYLSNINSSYNAFAAEIQNRSLKSAQFDLSYTWAHALDFFQNASTAGNTDNWYNPYANARANYGNSSFDTPNRVVGYVLYNFPGISGGSALKYVTNDWSLDDTFQIQTGLPYSAGTSGKTSNDSLGSYWNGNNSVSYIPQLGHNNYFYRRAIVDDIRVEKQFRFAERYDLQMFLQAFNLANHQNPSSYFTEAYALASTGATTGTATYQSNFGTVNTTNNSGFSYTPRQLELSARFSF